MFDAAAVPAAPAASSPPPAAAPTAAAPSAAAAGDELVGGSCTASIPAGCRLLLVRRAGSRTSAPAWSLLLPAGWVTPFWQALVHAGAKPAGQREWAWVAAAQQQPLPPLDYPDSAAAASTAAELARQAVSAANRRPLGRWAAHAPTSSAGSGSSALVPCLDWTRLGQTMVLQEPTPAAAGAGAGAAAAASEALPPVQACWAAAAQQQAAVAAVKRQQRQHRHKLRAQEAHANKQQQLGQVDAAAAAAAAASDAAGGPAGRPDASQPRLLSQKQVRQQLRHLVLDQQQQQPAASSSLLPRGCYVARSWRVLLAALPAAAPPAAAAHGRGRSRSKAGPASSSSGGSRAVPAAVLAAGRQPSKALQTALAKGKLAWAPVGASSSGSGPGSSAAPAAVAAAAEEPDARSGPAAAMEVDADARAPPASVGTPASGPGCLVRVCVRVLGKGRCRAGAAIVAAAGCSSNEVVRLLGYVTVAVPRGAPAARYPGGTGFCSAAALWRLRAADARPGSSRVLRVGLINPGGSGVVVRRAELVVVLDEE